MDLTLQQLRCFVAVAEELHFSRAAARLHVTAPSLSQQVSALERTFGTALFQRTSRHVELTPAGEELLPLARQALDSTAQILAWGARRREVGASLQVGMVVGGPIHAAILAEASRRLTGVRCVVRRLSMIQARDAVRSGACDVVIVPALEPPSLSGVRMLPLWSESRVLAVAAAHRLAGRDAIGIDETDGETFYAIDSDDDLDRRDWFAAPRSSGSVPRIETVRRGVDGVLDRCATGLGVGITASTTPFSYKRHDIAYVPIRGIPDIKVYLLRASRSGTAAVPAFEHLALQVANRLAARYGAIPFTA